MQRRLAVKLFTVKVSKGGADYTEAEVHLADENGVFTAEPMANLSVFPGEMVRYYHANTPGITILAVFPELVAMQVAAKFGGVIQPATSKQVRKGAEIHHLRFA